MRDLWFALSWLHVCMVSQPELFLTSLQAAAQLGLGSLSDWSLTLPAMEHRNPSSSSPQSLLHTTNEHLASSPGIRGTTSIIHPHLPSCHRPVLIAHVSIFEYCIGKVCHPFVLHFMSWGSYLKELHFCTCIFNFQKNSRILIGISITCILFWR